MFPFMHEATLVFRPAFQSYKFSIEFFGELLQLAHAHVLAVYFEVDIRHGADDVPRSFGTAYHFSPFTIDNFPAMEPPFRVLLPIAIAELPTL